MTFHAYTDHTFKKMMGEGYEYQVMINPEQFSRSMTAMFNRIDTMFGNVSAGRFANMQPVEYNFTLVIDGTGVVPTLTERKCVKEHLAQLKKVLFTETEGGVGYEPNYVEITYCDEIFQCVATSFKVDYSLFKPNGEPLRAKVTCAFKSICHIEPGRTPSKKTTSGGESKFDEFKDALASAYENALDSLFELPEIKMPND